MKAVRFRKNIPKYLATRALSSRIKSISTSPLSCVSLVEMPIPAMMNDQWLRIKTLRSGICATDLSVLNGTTNLSLEPFGSAEFILGHEIVGEIIEKPSGVKHLREGDRVAIEPTLSCITRGIQNRCVNCRRGMPNLCSNIIAGDLSPALSIGFNKETGGGWGEYLSAHVSQVYKLSDRISSDEGVFAEPLSVALHSVLRRYPPNRGIALVMGTGTIGLLTIAVIRMLRLRCKIIATGRYAFQRDKALELGANIVVDPAKEDIYEVIARETKARILKPSIGKRVVEGGVHCVYDTITTNETIDDALRLTRAGGAVVLVGAAGTARGIDLTPVWFREIDLLGSVIYGTESFRGRKRKTFEMALEFLERNKKLPLGSLITHRFRLDEWKRAIRTAQARRSQKSIKVVFTME
jgi:L-iditol 2-dehydrogenase